MAASSGFEMRYPLSSESQSFTDSKTLVTSAVVKEGSEMRTHNIIVITGWFSVVVNMHAYPSLNIHI